MGVCVTLPMLPFAAVIVGPARPPAVGLWGGSRTAHLAEHFTGPAAADAPPYDAAPAPAAGTAAGPGRIVLAATPIGNVGDAPPGWSDCWRTADVVAAEDTRRLRPAGPRPRHHPVRPGRLLLRGQRGAPVPPSSSTRCWPASASSLVTDAGMPSVSDPGYRLVAAAVEPASASPPSRARRAVLTALAVSGLPVDRFCFEGFLPRKAGERARRLPTLAAEDAHDGLLRGAAPDRGSSAPWPRRCGADRAGAVCRELTKTHEEVRRGSAGRAGPWAADGSAARSPSSWRAPGREAGTGGPGRRGRGAGGPAYGSRRPPPRSPTTPGSANANSIPPSRRALTRPPAPGCGRVSALVQLHSRSGV